MTSPTSSPSGHALVLVASGVAVAITGSLAALATGDRAFMGLAAAGFAWQFAGWVLYRRRNGGAR